MSAPVQVVDGPKRQGDRADLGAPVWIVTGGSRGIGFAIASLALERGARVIACDLHPPSDDDFESLGGRADGFMFERCDVTESADLERVFSCVRDRFGGLDILVNNAGIHERMLDSPRLLEMRPESFRRVLEVNLVAIWSAVRFAVPLMRGRPHPAIVNAGSTASFTGYPDATAYGASKGGVGALTKCLAVDLAPHGIRVNAYCPGATETPMIADLLRRQPDEAVARWRSTSSHLVRRYGEPLDVAELVYFLASPRSAFINGALIPIDGGSLAWRGTVDALGFDRPPGA